MSEHLNVMISSTRHDLSKHRSEVQEACLRQGMYPLMMEYLAANDDDAVKASLELVDRADVYVGIFAHWYGHQPEGSDVSITEMEYQRAVERGIPRHVFLMDLRARVNVSHVETGAAAAKLALLKARIAKENIVDFFRSPEDLRARVITALAQHRSHVPGIHPTATIPARPRRYVAHPYTLLETRQLVGRQRERRCLDQWLAKQQSATADCPVLAMVSIGGLGKSALAWDWFNRATADHTAFAGAVWWSFYESDSHFENFVTRTLAYLSGQREETVARLPLPEREERLLATLGVRNASHEEELIALLEEVTGIPEDDIARLSETECERRLVTILHACEDPSDKELEQAIAYVQGVSEAEVRKMSILDREDVIARVREVLVPSKRRRLHEILATHTLPETKPFLLVLDGLERILTAYTRPDAARLSDDELDKTEAAAGDAEPLRLAEHRLRRAADHHAGVFLSKLKSARRACILLTTRLLPFELGTDPKHADSGCQALELEGLGDDDAFELWHSFGVSGDREELRRFFRLFGSHPLLIQILARSIAQDPTAAGDFPRWRKEHPDLDLGRLPLRKRKTHILWHALQGLSKPARKLLETIAGFRMPVSYETLVRLLVGPGKTFGKEDELDVKLTELDDRGLIAWVRSSNRYDLHPVVRGVVWDGISGQDRQVLYSALRDHFQALLPAEEKAYSMDELAPGIELVDALTNLKQYDEAVHVFFHRLHKPLLQQLCCGPEVVKLLEPMLPEGGRGVPSLQEIDSQAEVLYALASGYRLCGRLRQATRLYDQHNELRSAQVRLTELTSGLVELARGLLAGGFLFEAEAAGRRALCISRQMSNLENEAISLCTLGSLWLAVGKCDHAQQAFQRVLRIARAAWVGHALVFAQSGLAQQALLVGDLNLAREHSGKAWEIANAGLTEREIVATLRLQAEGEIAADNLVLAHEQLRESLRRARNASMLEEEEWTLVRLAEVKRRQCQRDETRALLDEALIVADAGGYQLLHVEALVVLAALEQDCGRFPQAREVAEKAYRQAWCEGKPYAYLAGLTAASRLLAIQSPGWEPGDLPPFTLSQREPLRAVMIDPPDRFGETIDQDYSYRGNWV